MTELDPQQKDGRGAPPARSWTSRFLWQQLPYIVALVLAVGGVAYTNISHQPLVGYWEFLAMAIGVVCVITKWPSGAKEAQFRLIWTQALHWVAVLVTMNLMLVPTVQRVMPAPATSLVLLTLLALGTFLAGVSVRSLQISFLGLAMAVVVPAISWVHQSVIFFLLGAVLLIGLGIAFWLHQDRPPAPASAGTKNHVEAFMRKIHILGAIGMLTLLCTTAPNARAESFRVGRLVCSSTPRVGMIVGSTQSLRCIFHAVRPARQYIYEGRIRRVGLDVGVTSGGILSWAVFAKNSRIGPGTLRGHYVGASGNVAAGPGLGANVLIGGSRRSIMLQPLSIERSIGVNLAAGVTSLTLGARGRR